MAGAMVLRGPLSFGKSSRVHSARIQRLLEDLPMLVEMVDSQDKIDHFLQVLDGMMSSGLVTVEKVQVPQYGESVEEYFSRNSLSRGICEFRDLSF
jgi:uncharacterized protein